MIIRSNAGSGLAYLLLAFLVVTDVVERWMAIAWSLVTGVLAALVVPAQQAILPQLIDMRAIARVVALNGTVWNSMRIIGPAIAVVGLGQAFFVTTVGYAIALILLFTLKTKPRAANHRGGGGMMEGVRFIFSDRLFLAVIGLSLFTSVFGSSHQVLLVFFSEDILMSALPALASSKERPVSVPSSARFRSSRSAPDAIEDS